MPNNNFNLEIKPLKIAFFLTRSIVQISIAVFLILASLILTLIPGEWADETVKIAFIVAPVIAAIILLLLNFLYLNIVYSKTRYVVSELNFKMYGGGIFSNYQSELVVPNITQISLNINFLENLFFKSGTVVVKAAGSASDEIVFENVKNPHQVYQKVQDIMELSVFDLESSSPALVKNPSLAGVILNNLYNFITFIFFLLGFVTFSAFSFEQINLGVVFGGLVILISSLGWLLLKFYWEKNAVYSLFEDKITYSREFLNKQFSLIPLKNVADTDTSQNFWDRFLNIHSVIISCQGAENNILFSNLSGGDDFVEQTSELLKKQKNKISKASVNSSEADTLVQTEFAAVQSDSEIIAKINIQTSSWSKTFQPEKLRSLLLPIILVIFGIILAVANVAISLFVYSNSGNQMNISEGVFDFFVIFAWPVIILFFAVIKETFSLFFTNYFVDENKLGFEYKFISKKRLEFSLDKITGMVVYQNPIDRIFKTYTLVFRSIGSNQPLSFKHIAKDNQDFAEIFKKLMVQEKETEIIKPSYSVLELIKSDIFSFVVTVLSLVVAVISAFIFPDFFVFAGIFVVAVAAILILILIYKHYFYKTTSLQMGKYTMEFQQGIWFTQRYFVLLENVRNTSSTKYIFSQKGKLNIDIAGQTMISEQVIQNFHFTLDFVDNIHDFHNDLEKTLAQTSFKPSNKPSQHVVIKENIVYKTSVATEMFFYSLFTIWLILFWPFILVVVYFFAVNKYYQFSKIALQKYSGIFYKTKTSIPYSRIDHINSAQQLIGKIFKTGNISIFTTGTSNAEIVMGNIEAYKKASDEIYQLYSKNNPTQI